VALNSRTIKVADGEKHDGTVGTGVRLLNSTSASTLFSTQPFANGFVTRISGLEVDNNARSTVSYSAIKSISPIRADVVIDNCIAHNTTGNANVRGFEITNSWYNDVSINNCIAYNIGVTHGGSSVATGFWAKGSRMDILNCVAYKITSTVNAYGRGYQVAGSNFSGGHELKNSISMGCEVDIVGFNANGHTNTNCLTSDATADGTGGIINKTASDQFVSTVAGSEDLHLLKTADAVGAGADLSSYTTTSDGNDTFSAIDVNGSNRAAFTGNSWDIGAHQYALTASIGTSSRDYSTISAWEADLDNTAKYGNGSNAVGECYDDSNFSELFTINGGTTIGLDSVLLTPATGEKHDGTSDTGVIVVSPSYNAKWSINSTIPTELRHMELKRLHHAENGTTLTVVGNSRAIFNGGILTSVGTTSRSAIGTGYGEGGIYNSIIYGDSVLNGFEFTNKYGGRAEFVNNTVVCSSTSTSSSCIFARDYNDRYGHSAVAFIKNNLLIVDGAGVAINYDNGQTQTSFPDYVSNMTNYSSFPTGLANLSDHITGIDKTKQFVSMVSGSEDLHLVMGSDALNVGADLGNTPEGVQYDIDGYDRTASITWDIGADEAHEIDGEFGYKGFLSYLNRTTLRAG